MSLRTNTDCHYATWSELDYLRDLAKGISSVVMIGAGPGVMLLACREGNRAIRATVIDNQTCEYVKAHLEQAGLGGDVLYVIADSAKVKWSGEPFDLLIVDGDHSYDGVKADLASWTRYVRQNGYIFLHDYDANGTEFADQERYPGVRMAVQEVLTPEQGYHEVKQVGTAIVFQKTGSMK